MVKESQVKKIEAVITTGATVFIANFFHSIDKYGLILLDIKGKRCTVKVKLLSLDIYKNISLMK